MKTKCFISQTGLLVVATMLLCGCHSTPSTPSPSDAENALRQEIQSESGGHIKLVSFKKTDGQSFVENAVQGYKMDFQAEIEFEANGVWLSQDDDTDTALGCTFNFRSGTPSDPLDVLQLASQGGRNVQRSQRLKIQGTITAEKKESGWKFDM